MLAEVVRRLIEDADCGAYALSLDQTIVSWNSRAEELTGFSAESVIGRRCYEVVGGRAAAGVTSVCLGGCPALAQLRSGAVPRSRLMEVLQTSGERTMVRMTPLVMPDDQDRATMLVHLIEPAEADSATAEPDPELAREQMIRPLTPRELQIMRLLVVGRDTQEIADQLEISPFTVRNHIRRARRKLNANTRIEAVLLAIRRGLLDWL